MNTQSQLIGFGAALLLATAASCDKSSMSGQDDLGAGDMAMAADLAPPPDLTGTMTLTAVAPALVSSAGGTDVKLSGAGFESAAQVSIAGAAAQSVAYVSAMELAVKTPAKSGACGPVAVSVKNPGTGQVVTRTDLLRYFTATVSFMAVTPTLAAATKADLQAVGAGDFSGDGKPDLVAVQGDGNLALFKSNQSGGFDASAAYGATGTAPRSAAVGDIDGDGIPEFITANNSSDNLTIRFSKAGAVSNVALDSDALNNLKPRQVITADINGDSKLDVVTANESGSVTVLLNGGTSLGAPKTTVIDNTFQLYAVAAGHTDSDTKLDLVVTNGGVTAGTIIPLKGDGNGGFTAGTPIATGKFPRSIVLADFNGDQILDVAVPHLQDNNVKILKGDGSSGFALNQTLTGVGQDPDAVAVGDFNCDGRPDLVVANRADSNPGTVGDGKVTIFVNDGAAMLPTASPITIVTGEGQPRWIAITDVDADGRPDIVVTNNKENSLAILLNKSS